MKTKIICLIVLASIMTGNLYSQKYLFRILDVNNKYGVINDKNEIQLGFVYKNIIRNNLITLVDSNNNIGLSNYKLATILPCKFQEIRMDCSDTFVVKQNNKYGYYNTKGENLFPINFDKASLFDHDKALVAINSKYKWLNKTGKLTKVNEPIDTSYFNRIFCVRSIYTFDTEMNVFEKNGQYGVKQNNNWIIQPIYDEIKILYNNSMSFS